MRAERDVALCAVADAQIKTKVMNAMIRKRLPYAEEWTKVPLLQRKKYEGAKEVCVIITHGEKVYEAKKAIEALGEEIVKRVQYDIKGLF